VEETYDLSEGIIGVIRVGIVESNSR
jgi:hypothetical protein